MSDYEQITTDVAVETYDTATGIFAALLREVRELSKKKPDATLSASKVKLINNVLNDLLTILKDEPEGKYIELLEDDDLPQFSDALMMMVQFDAALDSFKERYYQYVRSGPYRGHHYWITEETLASWVEEQAALEAEDDEEEDDI